MADADADAGIGPGDVELSTYTESQRERTAAAAKFGITVSELAAPEAGLRTGARFESGRRGGLPRTSRVVAHTVLLPQYCTVYLLLAASTLPRPPSPPPSSPSYRW